MLKTVAYTVRAGEQQAARWRRAASMEGCRNVGLWLGAVADRWLKSHNRPLALAWRRSELFRVRLADEREATVRGALSHPFGVYRGDPHGPDRDAHGFVLVYLAAGQAGRILATLRHQQQAKHLAAELAVTWVRWEGSEPSEDPAPIVARHVRESV